MKSMSGGLSGSIQSSLDSALQPSDCFYQGGDPRKLTEAGKGRIKELSQRTGSHWDSILWGPQRDHVEPASGSAHEGLKKLERSFTHSCAHQLASYNSKYKYEWEHKNPSRFTFHEILCLLNAFIFDGKCWNKSVFWNLILTFLNSLKWLRSYDNRSGVPLRCRGALSTVALGPTGVTGTGFPGMPGIRW